MWKRILYTMLILGILNFAVACGGGGGGSSSTSDEGVTLTTKISMDGTRARAAETVTVTLVLADGTSVVMESLGNDEYTCTVDYTDGDPVYIYADVDNITLKNFFDSIDVTGGAADLGDTTPLTTMFVDVLAAMAEKLGAVIASPADLISAVQDATLQIDVETIRAESTDEGNATYSVLQQMYQAQLTWNNTTGVSVNSTIASSVQTTIAAGGISIPITGSEVETASAAAYDVASKLLSGDIDYYASVLSNDLFLDNGYTAEESILQMEDQFGLPAGYSMNIVSLSANAVALTTDDPAYALNTDGHIYRIHIANHYQMLNGDGDVVYEESYDDTKSQDAGIVVKKIGDAWFVLGNQEKLEYYHELTADYGSSVKGMFLEVCETEHYPVASVYATSSAFSGQLTFGPKDYEPNCLVAQLMDDSTDVTWSSSTDRLCGKSVTFHVTYEDSTTETKTRTMPACLARTVTASAAKNANGSVTVTYTLPSTDTASEINIGVTNSTNDTYFGVDNAAFSARTYTFPAANFESGLTYTIRVMYNDKYNRQYAANAVLTY